VKKRKIHFASARIFEKSEAVTQSYKFKSETESEERGSKGGEPPLGLQKGGNDFLRTGAVVDLGGDKGKVREKERRQGDFGVWPFSC